MIDENSTRTELVKYFNEMIQENNDHLKELYGIINKLKAELNREREAVDFYADVYNWQISHTGVEALITPSDRGREYIGALDMYLAVGGKKAREIQKLRKEEL